MWPAGGEEELADCESGVGRALLGAGGDAVEGVGGVGVGPVAGEAGGGWRVGGEGGGVGLAVDGGVGCERVWTTVSQALWAKRARAVKSWRLRVLRW
jgi:hypothetical protein